MNWVDTARVYGLGHSERIVARALENVQERIFLVTKCAEVWDQNGEITGSMRSDSIRAELEASLEALEGRRIDAYLIHQPNPDHQIEEGWQTLLELKEQGLVGHVGVSNFSLEQMKRAERIGPIDLIEPPYSLLDRSIEREILPHCEDHGIGVIAYSPMASGLLTGRMSRERVQAMPDDDWRKSDPRFQDPQLGLHLDLAAALAEIGPEHGVPAGLVACAWVLADPRVHAGIVGFRRAEQVAEILASPELLRPSDGLLANVEGRDRWPPAP